MNQLAHDIKYNPIEQTIKFFERILKESVDSILITDDSQNIILCNEAFCSLIGKSKHEIIETNLLVWLDLFEYGSIQKWSQIERDVKLNGASTDNEFKIKTMNGMNHLCVNASLMKKITIDERDVIISIWRNTTNIKLAEEKIKASLKEKETLLREIHHRVKNNMNIIVSLLNLQLFKSNSDEVKSQFQEMINRIISMSKVHEMLYKSENLADIDFSDHLQSLLEKTYKSYIKQAGNIGYTINADNIKLDMEKAIPCSLIITELFSNAMKYAFPESRKGEIAIDFKKGKDSNYSLIISDNGIGLPDGFDIKSTNTLGLTLVDALTKQLKGELEISGKKGTKITITFPGE